MYLSAATMLLLNKNNKDLDCQEVTLLNESPVEHTKLHYKIEYSIITLATKHRLDNI